MKIDPFEAKVTVNYMPIKTGASVREKMAIFEKMVIFDCLSRKCKF